MCSFSFALGGLEIGEDGTLAIARVAGKHLTTGGRHPGDADAEAAAFSKTRRGGGRSRQCSARLGPSNVRVRPIKTRGSA
jgi:hypothetical protein